MTARQSGLRLTEMLASLSLATDLGTGQPLGHGLRSSLYAVRIGREMDLSNIAAAKDDVRRVQQVSLLRFLSCTADVAKTGSRWVGVRPWE